MISELRKATARANGAKSRGPRTAAGKRKSCRNSFKHGLYATNAVMLDESPELFAEYLQGFVDEFQPQTPHLLALVRSLAAAAWLVARARQTEADLLNAEYDNQAAADPTAEPRTLAGRAYSYLAEHTPRRLILLGRCEKRYNRMFFGTFRRIDKELANAAKLAKITQRTKLQAQHAAGITQRTELPPRYPARITQRTEFPEHYTAEIKQRTKLPPQHPAEITQRTELPPQYPAEIKQRTEFPPQHPNEITQRTKLSPEPPQAQEASVPSSPGHNPTLVVNAPQPPPSPTHSRAFPHPGHRLHPRNAAETAPAVNHSSHPACPVCAPLEEHVPLAPAMRLSSCFREVPALMLLTGQLAMAQRVAVGMEGGVRTTDDLSGTLNSESKRYIVGPTVEIRLPMRLSFEFDALYRRLGFTGYQSSCCGSSITRERANSWEFPMILNYHLPVLPAHPFVGVGYAPRTIHGTDVSSGSYLSGIGQNPPTSIYTYFFNQHSATSYSVTNGVVVSGGLNLGFGHVRFTPELRYVYWKTPFLDAFGGDGSFQFASSQNEVFVLLGVSWH